MQKREFKKILFEIFDVLEFSETEKQEALESFKKKLADALFALVKEKLPQEEQDWIRDHAASANFRDPKIAEIQNAIRALYPAETIHEKSRTAFKRILLEYVDFMSCELDLGQGKALRLREIVEKL